jgi:prepilin-type N-terminal cleavage/methylation domain-containing protein
MSPLKINRKIIINFIKMIEEKKGMSFIEVLVSIVILGVIAIPFTTMFITSVKYNYNAKKKMEAYSIANQCMEKTKDVLLKISDNGNGNDEELEDWDDVLAAYDAWDALLSNYSDYKVLIRVKLIEIPPLKLRDVNGTMDNLEVTIRVLNVTQSDLITNPTQNMLVELVSNKAQQKNES